MGHFRCEQCTDFVVAGAVFLRRHVAKEHLSLRCADCDFVTKSPLLLDNHAVAAHQKVLAAPLAARRSLTCRDCGHLADTEAALAQHVEEKHGERLKDRRRILAPPGAEVVKCGKCDFVTKSPKHLQMHEKYPHTVSCELCEYMGLSDKFLVAHVKSRHSGQPVPKRNQCHYCPYATETRSALDKHIRALHLKQKLQCPLCDFTAVWSPLLRAHKIKVHCSAG